MLEHLDRSQPIACDTETTGLSPYGSIIQRGIWPARPFAFSFTDMAGQDAYIRFQVNPYTREVLYHDDWAAYEELKEFFEDESFDKVWHNANFDIVMLRSIGIRVLGKSWDTRILAHCADSSRRSYALKPLCYEMFGYPIEDQTELKESVKKARREGKKLGYALAEDVEADYHLGEPGLCQRYAVGDTRRTIKLYRFYQKIYQAKQEAWSAFKDYKAVVDLEHELLPIVREMTFTGCALDDSKIDELEQYYLDYIDKMNEAKKAMGYEDLNPKSAKQKMEVFYEQMGLPKEMKKRKKKGEKATKTATTDKGVLYKWSNEVPLAQTLLELSEAQHQLTSFIQPFRENGTFEHGIRTIHPNFNTCGPITGRMSCNNPNLQNISSETSAGRKSQVEFRARECFRPRPDCVWVLADYSQIEIWCTAFLSKDPVMTDALLTGKSLHDITCQNLFGLTKESPEWETKRKLSKNINFALQYGAGPGQIADMLGVPYEEALDLVRKYWETYAGVEEFGKRLQKQYKRDGYVKNVFGRTYRVHEDRFAYKLLNYVSQGTSADITKRAMVNVDRMFKSKFPRFQMLLQVHDELVSEGPKSDLSPDLFSSIAQAMQGNYHELLGIPNPLQVEVSIATENWSRKSKTGHI